jgi:type III pantothenate kinase
MVLCVDIGNTNTKVGAFDKDALLFVFAFATDVKATSEQIEIILKHGFEKHGLTDMPRFGIERAVVSSVVQQATRAVVGAIEGICEIEPICVPLDMGVGADLYCSIGYVKANFELPAAVFSLGTATTMAVIDEKGEILGGMIYPGAVTGVVALAEKASALPMVALKVPEEGFLAKTTVGAMQSGVVFGTAEMLDGLAERVMREYGVKSLILCGGLSELIGGQVRNKFIIDENTVLKGANEIYG